jgi:carbon-monoxide dehydrogenase medium subunit
MKSAPFTLSAPVNLEEAIASFREGGMYSKFIAGSQSLGPMLNLRLSQPDNLISLRNLPDLREVTDVGDSIFIGAGITHAEIEDKKILDPSRGLMASVAANIAYRAVRNFGTIGGSLAHADPASDWVNLMQLLDAKFLIVGSYGEREVTSNDFMQAAFTTCLKEDEILLGVKIRKLSVKAKFAYFKFCRKVGEFAEAIGAVLVDPELGIKRAIIGATAGTPFLIKNIDAVINGQTGAMNEALLEAGCNDDYEYQMHKTALERALTQAKL